MISILYNKGLPGSSGKPTVWVYAYELPTGPGWYGGDGGMRSFLSSLTKLLNKIKKAKTIQKKCFKNPWGCKLAVA
jgi:hypothetical protein